mgnify:CR=1 FL=1
MRNFPRKKNDEEEDFLEDEPEDETVKAPVAKSSAKTAAAQGPGKAGTYFQTGTFFQDHPKCVQASVLPRLQIWKFV